MYTNEQRTIITCNVSTTVSGIMSSVTAIAKQFVLGLFPKDYFKEVYITTTAVSNEQAETDEHDNKMKKFPRLSVNPGYIPDHNDAVMNPFPMWRRGHFEKFRNNRYYGYKSVFFNDEDDIYIQAIPNRLKFHFEIKIEVESTLEKIDVTHLLRQKLNDNEKFFLNNILFETEIPNSIITAIASIKGYNLDNLDERKDFYDYLTMFSNGQIKSKTYSATGRQAFGYLFASNILLNVDGAPNTDAKTRERINMAEVKGSVDTSFSLEMWIPGNYILECKDLPEGEYNEIDSNNKITIDHSFQTRPPMVIGNLEQYAWEKFITDVNVKVDKICFESMFRTKSIDLIKKLKTDGQMDKINELYKIFIYRDSTMLEIQKDYRINWDTFEVEMVNPLFNYVYNIGIYVDKKEILTLLGVLEK